MMSKYFDELQHGSIVAYPLHHAALRGDHDAVATILSSLKNNGDKIPINEPDDAGRSAIFYAQLHSHDEIVRTLASNGWTAMPEGNIYKGPGGRRVFWDYTPGVTSAISWRSAATPRASAAAPALSTPGRFVRVAVAASGVDQQRKDKILSRQYARKMEDQLRAKHALYSVTRDHKFYARKTVGCAQAVRATKKPGLNVCDYAAAYSRFGDRLEAARTALYESDEEEEEEEVIEEVMEEKVMVDGTNTAHDYSLARVARFVVDRRPTRAADGTWVVIQAAEPEDAVVPTDPCDDVISLASFAASSDLADDEWPALPGARTVPLDNTIDEVNEADWDVLDDEADDELLVSEDHHHHESDGMNEGRSSAAAGVAGGVWSGAAATRAAVLAA